MKRQATFKTDEASVVGAWELTCETCPLAPHLDALNMKREPCLAGIQTNMQGHVPLKTCPHYGKDSIENGAGNSLSIVCNHVTKGTP